MIDQATLDAEQASIASLEQQLTDAKLKLAVDRRDFDRAQAHVWAWTTLIDNLRVYGDEASGLASKAFEAIKEHI